MKKLLMLIMLCLLVSCASKQPHRYNSVEEYTNSTNSTTEIGHWESPAYKKQKNSENKETTSKVFSWIFRTLTSPSLIP